jgi:hypothetical protein
LILANKKENPSKKLKRRRNELDKINPEPTQEDLEEKYINSFKIIFAREPEENVEENINEENIENNEGEQVFEISTTKN